jgi:hypothetical protein
MLAVTASTAPPETTEEPVATASVDLDRTERGESTEEAVEDSGDVEERNEMMERHDPHDQERQPVVRVGVADTIKRLWDSEAPLVRRFR